MFFKNLKKKEEYTVFKIVFLFSIVFNLKLVFADSGGNKQVNFIEKDDGDIELTDAGDIVVNGNVFTESYAKTKNGSIIVKKNIINILETETGEAFFNAVGGDVNINTSIGEGNKGSIIINGTKQINGFAKSTNNIIIETGIMTINTIAINNNNYFIDGSKDITIKIDELNIKAQQDSTVPITKSFFNSVGKANVTLGSLDLEGALFFDKEAFLINSLGDATLTINNIDKDLLGKNTLAPKIVKTGGNLILSSFDFSDKGIIDNLNLLGLFDNVSDSVILSSSLVKNNNNITTTLPSGKYLFNSDNMALVEVVGNDRIIVVDNSNSILKIGGLSVANDAFINTAIVLTEEEGTHKVEIKAKEFALSNSKFGAIVIDENNNGSNGSGIEITSTENLFIFKNTFLQSLVVAPKQNITIAGGNDKETNIRSNTISKAISTDETITIGSISSSVTSFNSNLAKEGSNIGSYFITANTGIKILGKEINIKGNITNDSEGSSYGLFKTVNGDIEIGGDANTKNIVVSRNKTKQGHDAFLMMTDSGSIKFESEMMIDFNLDENTWKGALSTNGGEISFISENITIVGNNSSVFELSKSKLINFIETRGNLTIGNKLKTKEINLSGIVLKKEANGYFFKIDKDIKINGTEDSRFKVSYLKSDSPLNKGAFFMTGGNIEVNVGTLRVKSVTASDSTIFRQNNKNSEDIIAINNVNFAEDNKINGLYYGKGKSFKIHGYDENKYMNLDFTSEIDGIAAIKFGSEEDDANTIQYKTDAFTMKVGDFKLNPSSVSSNTKAGIVFTNPRYVGTDNGTTGDLKIIIEDGGILDLTMPNNLPSIAVVTKRQDNNDPNKKVFEFGETIIEGASLASADSKYVTIKMSGYNSLETSDFNNLSEDKNETTSTKIGKSKLTIGNNVKEFDTGTPGSQYILHEFEMKTGVMIINLDNNHKDANLFKWAGDYKTLSNGTDSKDTIINKGKIILADKVKLDIEGYYLEDEFVLIPQNSKFDFDFSPFKKSLLKDDNDTILEFREIIAARTEEGFIIKVGQRRGEDLINHLKEDAGLNEIHAKILASSIENGRSIVISDKGSGNSNFDTFSKNIYELARAIFRERQDKTKITNIINNVQMPDVNENNSGMIGTVGLSSIKAVIDVLGDRMVGGIIPIDSADSRMILLADANNGNIITKKMDNSVDLFAKVNYGFSKLKVSDGNKDISNYGILVGGDLGLLENKITLGTSFMFDLTNLEGSYRESKINSLIVSLYSKYDIFELSNRDKLFIYGVISYAYSWENEQAEVDNFNNKSNKSANIIAIDLLGGYRFNNVGITPEFGINFISGSQNSYQDELGQTISSKDSKYLSLKTNVRYDIPMEYLYDCITISFKIGVSYDILSNGSNGFDVENPIGLKYHVNDAESADKLSFNYGINFSYDLGNNSKISVSYNGTIIKNLFNNKFSFEYRYKIR